MVIRDACQCVDDRADATAFVVRRAGEPVAGSCRPELPGEFEHGLALSRFQSGAVRPSRGDLVERRCLVPSLRWVARDGLGIDRGNKSSQLQIGQLSKGPRGVDVEILDRPQIRESGRRSSLTKALIPAADSALPVPQ